MWLLEMWDKSDIAIHNACVGRLEKTKLAPGQRLLTFPAGGMFLHGLYGAFVGVDPDKLAGVYKKVRYFSHVGVEGWMMVDKCGYRLLCLFRLIFLVLQCVLMPSFYACASLRSSNIISSLIQHNLFAHPT
jgi:hypothetical protein